ncbi:glycosyltransferase [Muricoccus radiodurans]|uniref:glycosyltransferase n=1 Tax=Muricoccus radiodurans TaxID=2231721 RepID=UPI003CEDB7A8
MPEAAAPTRAATETAPEPEIAVVIPAHGQPGLLPEAVESVLAQRGPRAVAAVVVDDGCPYPQTREAALRLARRAPGRVHLLRRRQGGLSAARNTGVDFVLRAWPGCRSVFMLDSDNRLHPDFLARAAGLLESSGPATGWVYPDFDYFGIEDSYSAAGEHSLFLHLLENGCDAGSLVARSVFEAGLRYDETMRSGFEDWDFWLRAAAAGFRGRHVPLAGFRYRRRAESMRLTAERQRPVILGGMRARLAPMIRPRPLLALEAAEVPRFLLLRSGSEAAEFVVDPLRSRHPPETRDAMRRRLVEAMRRPAAIHAPAFTAFASDGAMDALNRTKLLHNALWQTQRLLRGAEAVAITIAAGNDDAVRLERNAGSKTEAALLVLRTTAFSEAAAAGRTDWLDAARTATLRLVLPHHIAHELPPAVLPEARSELAALSNVFGNRHPDAGEWRADWRRPRGRAHEGYKELLGLGAVLPWLSPEGGRDIGLLLPIFELGGVERVIVQYARALRARGWRPHLILTGADRANLPADALDIFETVQFPPAPGMEGADTLRHHLGAALPGLAEGAEARDLAGIAAPMHAVLATHALAAHAVMGALRGLGVVTFAGLHLVERDAVGLPRGNPQALLAFEGAYDGVVVVSRALRDWCVGQGIPDSKVVIVPNGPGYDADPGAVAQALAARAEHPGRPLRALFLGRLDAQKGLDRLRDAIAFTGREGVEWRVVGRAVLDAATDPGAPVEPPPAGPAGLDTLFAWADVLVLPSRFEGAPLTVLEAQRFGCIPVATDTGALREQITDGVDGRLVPSRGSDAEVAVAVADALLSLARDPASRRAMARAAASRAAGAGDWAAHMTPWMTLLERIPDA